MLDDQIKQQLSQHFASLESKITLEMAASEHEMQTELMELLHGVASTSNQINVLVNGVSQTPFFRILKNDQPTGIEFTGIPGGHEFTSLILAILNTDGKGRLPDELLQCRIKSIQGPIHLRTYISLYCTNCPDVVQALNQIALIHGDLIHQMVDGGLVQNEVEQLGILGVPSVMTGNHLIHSGKADLLLLIEALERQFGKKEIQLDLASRDPFDVLVIGGGPAGASSAIYSARKGLRVGVVARKIGGQVNDTKAIENLISILYTEGPILSHDLRKQMEHYGIELLENREVEDIQPLVESYREVNLSSGEKLKAQQIIIASGASWRKLNIPGEKEHIGSGVHFCPHCDGPFYKGKRVAVIGGGNSGIEAALDLAGVSTEVTVLEFADTLRADQVLIQKAEQTPNVKILRSVRCMEVLGDGGKVKGLRYEERSTGAVQELELEGIFVQIGLSPNSGAFKALLDMTPQGEICIDSHNRTSAEVIYAAGDVTTIPYKQIVIAVGEGAKASLAAFEDRLRQ